MAEPAPYSASGKFSIRLSIINAAIRTVAWPFRKQEKASGIERAVIRGNSSAPESRPASEAYRTLRTNVTFVNAEQRQLKLIVVTSPGPGEGKSTIAANLAAIIAQGGKRVLLIDADMRRPRIHSIFGISNRVGLSTLFRGNMTVRSVMSAVAGVDNIFIIPSGSPPPNPTELLASARMDQIFLS
mgnify:CR=1 FL=1